MNLIYLKLACRNRTFTSTDLEVVSAAYELVPPGVPWGEFYKLLARELSDQELTSMNEAAAMLLSSLGDEGIGMNLLHVTPDRPAFKSAIEPEMIPRAFFEFLVDQALRNG
jgi:hypothetical protein